MDRRHFMAGAGATALLAGCAAAPSAATPETEAEAAYPPIGRIVDTSMGRVHAVDIGSGDGPPAVLLHGASGNVRDWTYQIAPLLAERRRVIVMDRPGFGYSERIAKDAWRPTVQAAQLREAANALGVQNPVVVGHSWGATVANAWALDAPDNVSGVVSVSGVTMPWGGLTPVLDALGFGSVIASYYTSRITKTAENGGIERFINRAFRPQQPPTGYLDYVGAPLSLRQKTLDANAEDLANTNPAVREIAARYGEMRVPVEIMHGDADWLLDIDQHGREYAEALPEARLTPLPRVGHMAHHARPGVLSEILDRFG